MSLPPRGIVGTYPRCEKTKGCDKVPDHDGPCWVPPKDMFFLVDAKMLKFNLIDYSIKEIP